MTSGELDTTTRAFDPALADYRHALEVRCGELLVHAEADDGASLDADWPALEADLLDELGSVEDVILPKYALETPGDAQRIVDAHVGLRSLMAPVGHPAPVPARLEHLRRLVSALAELSNRERASMYPWATQHIALIGPRLMYGRVCRSLDR